MSETEHTAGDTQGEPGGRPVTYCVVPHDLAARLHEPLRRHFRDDPRVEVIVERRAGERRADADRRAGEAGPRRRERRSIRGPEGRRVSERRAPVVPAPPPELPRRARRHADRLAFVERVEPPGERAEDLDSARLVTRFQAGDRDAFSLLYMRYFTRVYAYLSMVLNDRHEAEDATQQVFMHVLEALPRYERRRRPFRGWLFVVVRNQAVSLLRQRRRLDVVDPFELRELPEHDEAGDWELETLDWITDREMLLFIERLPVGQRQVVLLRYMMGLSIADIASLLGSNPNAVRALSHRALSVLRQRFVALGRSPREGGRTGMRRFVGRTPVVRARRYALLP